MQNAQMQNGNGKGPRRKRKERDRNRLRYCKKCNKLKKAKLPQLKCKKDIPSSSWAYWKCTERSLQLKWRERGGEGERELRKVNSWHFANLRDFNFTYATKVVQRLLAVNVYSLQVGKQFERELLQKEKERRTCLLNGYLKVQSAYQAYALCAESSLWQ